MCFKPSPHILRYFSHWQWGPLPLKSGWACGCLGPYSVGAVILDGFWSQFIISHGASVWFSWNTLQKFTLKTFLRTRCRAVQGPNHMHMAARLNLDAQTPVRTPAMSSLQVIPAPSVDMWVKKPPDDSSPASESPAVLSAKALEQTAAPLWTPEFLCLNFQIPHRICASWSVFCH